MRPPSAETERALKHLLRLYTKDRDWVMVEALFLRLGALYEAE